MRILAATLLSAALSFGVAAEAQAAIAVQPIATDAPIIKTYGGCGPYRHRGPYGGCRPGGQWGGYGRGRACPPGFHLGGGARRCWPN